MKSRRAAVLAFGCVLVMMAVRAGLAGPSPNEKNSFAAADAQILAEIRDHSEAMANLEHLSDSIGQRLTGSPQQKRANEWTRDMFQKYGLTNAHMEPWTIARSWTRGSASARIVSPAEHPLTIAAAGWSPGTQGAVHGPVVYFDAKAKEEFAKFHGKLKGAIVIYQEPASLSPPKPADPYAEVTRPMQQPPPRIGEPPLIAELDTKILEQVKTDEPQLKANLTYLADRIGPRLTGSPKLNQASHWTEEQFKAAGLANVHLEPWTIEKAWNRGTATGRIVSPAEQQLTLAAYGWSPATKETVRGQVIGIKAEKLSDLDNYKGKLKGAIVLVGPPGDLVPPENPLLTPFDRVSIPMALPKPLAEPPNLDDYIKLVRGISKVLEGEGAAAALMSSDKWYGLLNLFTTNRDYKEGKVPTASITRENQALLWRLLEAGPVEVEVSIQPSFSKKPVEVYNTVAEISGTEKPDEVVILGAHLDSWDLATGATDNGTGSMAVLEAARALQKLRVKPKRTIRFVLFTGEEQGLNGSHAYVKAHKDELGKISGVLVHDSGTGKVLTIGLMANYAARETMDHVLYPLAAAKDIELVEPSLRTEGGSDHVPFDEAGVPASWCLQDNVDYDKTHHSQADTLDRVRWDDLTEGAQVLAVFGYNVAQLPELLPRKPKPKQAD